MEAMLFDPARHEPLVDRRWDADAARAAIAAIVDDTLAACSPDGLWPPHPLDGHGSAQSAELYFGAAGVIYALDWLARAGAHDRAARFRRHVRRSARAQPRAGRRVDVATSIRCSWVARGFCSFAAASRLRLQRRTSSRCRSQRTPPILRSNSFGARRERCTRRSKCTSARARRAGRNSSAATREALARSFLFHPRARCHLWTQDFHGKHYVHLGAAHGFAGNAGAIIRGLPLLSEEERTWWIERIVQTAHATAMREGA